MTDKFDEALKKYRQQIKEGNINYLKQDIASGRISYSHKVNAANFAINEYEDAQNGIQSFPIPPKASCSSILKAFWLNNWKWLIGTFLFGSIALYLSHLNI